MSTLLFWIAALLAADGDASAGKYPRSDLVMEAAELTKPEVASQFRILDARGKHKYSTGHVPGAVWVDQFAWASSFAASQNPQTWSKRVGELGIDVKTKVVIYDDAL